MCGGGGGGGMCSAHPVFSLTLWVPEIEIGFSGLMANVLADYFDNPL